MYMYIYIYIYIYKEVARLSLPVAAHLAWAFSPFELQPTPSSQFASQSFLSQRILWGLGHRHLPNEVRLALRNPRA